MVIIFSLFAWFLWDVGYAVYCESWGHPLTAGEWLWAASGAIFAVLAMIYEFKEKIADANNEASVRETHLKEIGGLKERLAASHGYQRAGFEHLSEGITTVLGEMRSPTFDMRVAVSQIEALTKTVSSLKTEVKSQRRRSLTKQQTDILISELTSSEVFNVTIVFNSSNAEAEEYARQFWGINGAGNIYFGLTPTNEVPATLEGLVIRLKDHNLPLPPRALRLSNALNKAKIPHRFVNRFAAQPAFPVSDDYFDLAVGRKSDIENNSN